MLTRMFRRIAAGESVAAICRSGKVLPKLTTFWQWLLDDPEQLAKYEAALAMRAHVFAEELIAISDDTSGDYKETKNGPEPDLDHIQRAKLRVNTRQWVLSRLLPKKYGDRVQTEHSGSIATNLVITDD